MQRWGGGLLKQIRMRWSINGRTGCGDWVRDTPENRKLLEVLIRNGRRFGPHHLQARVAPTLGTPDDAKGRHHIIVASQEDT
jgi:hypothetical protein